MDNINKAIITGISLIPFIKYVISYFISMRNNVQDLMSTTLLKCAPIACLAIFIFLICFSFDDMQYNIYSERIVYGLIFSCVGDALLNVNLFPHGMMAFAIAQLWYIFAFGFKPLKLFIALPLYFLGTCFVALIYKSLDPIIAIGLPIYAVLLMGMCWRSLVNGMQHKNFISHFCSLCSILFVISDGIIAIDKFYTPISYAEIYIMSTYYIAQLGITLSILNGSAINPTENLRN